MFWLVVLGGVTLGGLACLTYLITRVLKYKGINMLLQKSRAAAIAVSHLTVIVPCAVLCLTISTLNTVICIIHLTIIWIVCDLIGMAILKHRRKKEVEGRITKEDRSRISKIWKGMYFSGIFALTVTIVYLGVCWFLAHHISATEYSLNTEKAVEPIRIVQIADAHIGTTFDAEGFSEAIDKINEYYPDMVVITGDLVDNSTPKEEFIKSCEALQKLNTRYGVYYCFGNHDKGYNSDMRMNGGTAQILEELGKNGVKVLQDEAALIEDSFYVIGRKDYTVSSRASIGELVSNLDTSKYMIVLDHQPRDFDAEASAGVDLVLSGHTHGGQLIPIGPFVGLLGSNDLVKGHEKRENTDFIVTSGISDWELRFKSGCKSEFVVIDIE